MTTLQFTPELSALQGVLISSDYEYPFKNLSAKGGNEMEIDSIINTIKNFLFSQNYLNDTGIVKDAADTMRRFALYISLNSDLEVLNELVNTDSTVDFLIWTVPTISKCLMSEMLWNLYMGDFVKEIISFSNPQFSIEVADALILNMKYMNPTECLQQLNILSTACFNILCRIHFFDFGENLSMCAYNNFQRCIAFFCNPPNANKLENLKKDELYKYYGNCLHTMLTILWECYNQYNATQTCELDSSVALYEVTYHSRCTKKINYKPCECIDKMIVEILGKCLTELLDNCMKLVMGINLDIFCAWSEFEEDGITMQQSVGELCYKVRQALLNSDLSEHAVVSMLEQISHKPVHVKEIINSTDSSVIREKINRNDNDSILWLQALLHKHDLMKDLELLKILVSNLDHLNENSAYEFFKKLQQNKNVGIENKQLIQILAIRLFQKCNSAVKHDIVNTHFKDEHFNNEMECCEFVCMLTEAFNKLAISPDSDLSDVLSVFLQNPRKVYVKIFKSAVENEQQTNLMFKVMTYLFKYAYHCYSEDTEPCLMIILRKALNIYLNPDAKQNNLTNFISKLKTANIISVPNLLLLIIMPKLYAALVDRDYKHIHLQCKLLHKCYSSEDLLEYRTPMLVMLAQVMVNVRWHINNFDILSPSILNLVIDQQTSLMNSYGDVIPEDEASWLKAKLRNLDSLNMYYFRQLWNPPGNTFVDVVSGVNIHINIDIEMLTIWLVEVLCSTTLQEWDCIWENLIKFGEAHILDLFYEAMTSVLIAEKVNRTNNSWACILYCYKNLFHCIRYKYFKEPLSNNQVLNVLHKLSATIRDIQEDNLEEFGAAVMPLFAYIAERKRDYTISISQFLENALPESKLSVMIKNLFRNGT